MFKKINKTLTTTIFLTMIMFLPTIIYCYDGNSDIYLTKTYQSEAGIKSVYQAEYNQHGVIFIDRQSNKLYLGKNCDAFSPKYGQGKWGQANGGFIVSFKNIDIGFPRQELTINAYCNL